MEVKIRSHAFVYIDCERNRSGVDSELINNVEARRVVNFREIHIQ